MKLKIYQNVTIFDAVKDMIGAIDHSDFSIEHIVLVPDRFSLICEKMLLEIMPSKALFNVRVVSLTKFSLELLERFGIKIKKENLLSSGETLLLTQKAIENVKNQFKTFKKNRISFCYEVSKLISQFKSSRITPDKLNENAKGLAGLKYHDLKLIYEEYQRLLGDKLDANERLNLLNEKFQTNALKNTKIYFAGFEAFTSESFVLLKNLIMGAREVNLTLAKSLDEGNDYIYEKDIFEKAVALCEELGVSAEVVSKKANMTSQKEGVVRGLYSYQKVNCENKGFYNLYSCMNISEEVEAVAKLIRYKVYKGERYKNMAIAVGGLDKYIVQIENIFDRYDIPYYIDSPLTADKTLLGRLIFSFFEVVVFGFSQDRTINLLSNILLGDNKSLIEKFQRLMVDNKQKYKKFIEKEFSFAEELDNLSTCKKAVEFETVILKIADKVQEKFDEVMLALEENDHLKERNINVQVYDILKDQLSLISSFYTEEISVQEYQKVLALLLSFKEVSTVPTFVDGVMIGDATESMFDEVNTLFVLGAQSLPAVSGDNGLLSDEDLSVNYSVIEPTIKMINRRNRFKLFSLLTLGKENLILTYQFLNEEGKKNELPSYISSLNSIFSQIELRCGNIFFNNKSEDLQIALLSSQLAFKEFKQIDKKELSCEKAKKLMFSGNRARVTQIENYFSCPFKHFLSYGLKLKEFEKAEVDGRDIGNICHAGAEKFIKLLIENKFDYNINLIDFIENNFDDFIDDNLKQRLELLSEKNSYIKLAKRQLLLVLKDIVRECKASAFKPVYVEQDFKSQFAKSGITLIGRADRIDFAGDYFRIIDYKTGKTGNILKELYFGEKLQLFLYQKEAKEKYKRASAGGYYFRSGLEFLKDDEDKALLKGLSPNDNEVIELLDNNLSEQSKSNILSIAKDSKGGYKGSGISKFDLTALCDYAYKVSERAVEEICGGFVQPKPCDSACDWCKFHTVCGYQLDARGLTQEIIF